MPIKCTNCEICGRQVSADLMCTIVVEEERIEKVCLCVCNDCKIKFVESIDKSGSYQKSPC